MTITFRDNFTRNLQTQPPQLKMDELTEHNKTYGYGEETLLVKKLHRRGFSYQQINLILSAVSTTCPECYQSERGCQCWNDD